jgi:hypothetical protein
MTTRPPTGFQRLSQTALSRSRFLRLAAELADLTIAIGLMNAYNRLAIGFRVPPKAALAEQQDEIVATNTASLDTRMSAQLGEQ